MILLFNTSFIAHGDLFVRKTPPVVQVTVGKSNGVWHKLRVNMYTADARYCLLLDIARYVQSWTQNYSFQLNPSWVSPLLSLSLCRRTNRRQAPSIPRLHIQCADFCCSTILFPSLCVGLIRFHTERVSWEHSLRKALVHTVLRFSDVHNCKILPFNISYK